VIAQSELPLFPRGASSFAGGVDSLFLYLLAVSAFFAGLIFLVILYSFVKYRRRQKMEIGVPIHGNMKLEAAWIAIPSFFALVMFGWGASIYINMRRAPQDTLDIYVVAKQWMWKLQQPDGRREINELHIPAGRNIRLIMASEDVIHDFFVPAFRVKQDVVPGRYTTMWFRATRPGRYRFFCSQYCGTNHAAMGGWVTVMEPAEYQAWLSGSAGEPDTAAAGAKLFQQLACISCHTGLSTGRGPVLNGLFGSKVQLADGRALVVDEAYIRQCILDPKVNIPSGYQPIMPAFQGLVTEEQILDLIAYIKSLPAPGGTAPGAALPEGPRKGAP
jgi:cytochrome c oxidase subunit 2